MHLNLRIECFPSSCGCNVESRESEQWPLLPTKVLQLQHRSSERGISWSSLHISYLARMYFEESISKWEPVFPIHLEVDKHSALTSFAMSTKSSSRSLEIILVLRPLLDVFNFTRVLHRQQLVLALQVPLLFACSMQQSLHDALHQSHVVVVPLPDAPDPSHDHGCGYGYGCDCVFLCDPRCGCGCGFVGSSSSCNVQTASCADPWRWASDA
mmetsp:Transcript_13121/g.15872  ORF Transcript_13121/g.15872 Transcript_13121/m.15872 type:complete len:212 (-) Transcript_13121:692-1327(-)